jgi:hypothetical protein
MSGAFGDQNGSSAARTLAADYPEHSFSDSKGSDATSEKVLLSSGQDHSLSQGHQAAAQRVHTSDRDDEGRDEYSDRRRRSRDLLIQTNIQAGPALPQVDDSENADAAKSKPISWRSLPRKDQLFVLTLARLSEPLTQTGLGSYLFYQLQSFDPSLPDSTISYQAGIIQAAFPFAQFLTAMLWGRFADSPRGGRKMAICIGLLGTMLSIIGFGFSHSFATSVIFRLVGGILNGNIGVMRTMISEIIKEKKYQSRAFLLLPMTFNVGVIIGPILGMRASSSAPGYSADYSRWYSCRSSRELPIYIRSRFIHRWQEWR